MYSNDKILVRRYISQLKSFYAKPWQLIQLEQLEAFQRILGPRHGILSYLRLSCIPDSRKCDLIMEVVNSLHLADILEPLIYLLKKNKNLESIFTIITILVAHIKKELRVEDIAIYTAHPLPDEDRINLEEWIKKERNALVVRSRVIIEPELIGGFRIEGSDFVGDYSIYRKLHNLQYRCMKEGQVA